MEIFWNEEEKFWESEEEMKKRLYKDEDGTYQIGRLKKWISKDDAKKIWPDKIEKDASDGN